MVRYAIGMLVGVAGLASGAAAAPSGSSSGLIGPMPETDSCAVACSHGASPRTAQMEAARKLIEMQTFMALPKEDQSIIAGKLIERGEPLPGMGLQDEGLAERSVPLNKEELDAAYAKVSGVVRREVFEGFAPVHQRMLASFVDLAAEHEVPVLPCFAPGTDWELVNAFEQIVFGQVNADLPDGAQPFEQTGRWGSTALNPGGGGQGNPTILTYSFPDDGITIPDGIGEGSGPNRLNAFMDGIYGNRATWRAIYDDIFAVWGELSGNTYVLEPNDDNVTLFNSPGVAGVRGDLRMGGKTLDGNSGTLAYNFFPQNGDMVIDTADGFYNNTGSNSLRLRNILWHEHGHGMGQLHVCPIEQGKLMEPFISLAFVGPQFDDILNAQRHYGDPLEPNDSIFAATVIGELLNPVTVDLVSLDDDNDADLYQISVPSPAEITATLRVQGFPYQAGPQTGSCSESQPYDPRFFLNPGLQLLDDDGSVIASINANPAGSDETLVTSVPSGTYYVRAFGTNPSGDQIIAYELDLDSDVVAAAIAAELPTTLTPGVATAFNVTIDTGGQPIDSATLSYRAAGEPSFTNTPLAFAGGSQYVATLPAFLCGEDPDFLVTVAVQGGATTSLPASGFASAIVTDGVAELFNDPGDVDLGYTTSSTASEGGWDLGAPQGNGRGDPAVDADGSGSAWLTEIDPNDDNSDIDNGVVTLTTPALNAPAGSTFSYAYWFNDTPNGELQGGDAFTVSVSSNGTSFTTVRTVTTASGSWLNDTLVEGTDFNAGTLFVRFSASDVGTQNVVEAGVDAILLEGPSTCTNPPVDDCPADINMDGVLTGADFNAWIAAFSAGDLAADQNNDGTLTGADFNAFISNFSAGCD